MEVIIFILLCAPQILLTLHLPESLCNNQMCLHSFSCAPRLLGFPKLHFQSCVYPQMSKKRISTFLQPSGGTYCSLPIKPASICCNKTKPRSKPMSITQEVFEPGIPSSRRPFNLFCLDCSRPWFSEHLFLSCTSCKEVQEIQVWKIHVWKLCHCFQE